jgi:hypothetical protein
MRAEEPRTAILGSFASPRKTNIHRRFIVESGCTPRIAGIRGELTTGNTVSRTSALAGRAKLPWRRRERQPDGSAAGGHPHFFGNPRVLRSAPQPAIRLHLMRDPVSPPLARPERERAGLLARRHFERSRIRCSWRPGTARFRRASSQADDGTSVRDPLKKIAMAPHCVRTLRATRRSTPDVQPETGKRSTGFGIAAERGPNRVGAPSPGSPATKSTKNRN